MSQWKAMLYIAVVLVALGIGATYLLTPDAPKVYERIQHEFDCGKLQREFNAAERSGDPDYMTAIDKRMREVGCYR